MPRVSNPCSNHGRTPSGTGKVQCRSLCVIAFAHTSRTFPFMPLKTTIVTGKVSEGYWATYACRPDAGTESTKHINEEGEKTPHQYLVTVCAG